MHISQVKTAFKIADVELVPGTTKLNFNYLSDLRDENGIQLPQRILTENMARVYLIVVDGEVKKIGGSQDQGGIKGRPSIRSYGIWWFLYKTMLEEKKNIEFFMIYHENFSKEVKGLFGYHQVDDAYISYKLIEKCCIADYLKTENGHYPEWNVQEQGMDWPEDVKNQHAEILSIAQTRNKKVKRREVTR